MVLRELAGGSNGVYTILVTDAENECNYDCSGEFYHVLSAGSPGTGSVCEKIASVGTIDAPQRGLAAAAGIGYVPRTFWKSDDMQQPGECEVALLTV